MLLNYFNWEAITKAFKGRLRAHEYGGIGRCFWMGGQLL